jgi:hypothetical protein
MRRKNYYILILMLFALSCKKGNPPSVFSKASYPLAVGDWWEYQLNAIGNSPDTIMLSVASLVNVGPYVQYKCYFQYHGAITDSAYFQQSDTSLSFINASPFADLSSIQNFHLKFPVSAGYKWQGAFPGDTIVVTGVVPKYSGYGLTYGPCYYLGEAYDLPHNDKTETMILTPKVGLIYQSIAFNSDTAEGGLQVQHSILLLNYHVQ